MMASTRNFCEGILCTLRGFSSKIFGKSLEDEEIAQKLLEEVFDHDSYPIFHVRPTACHAISLSTHRMLVWFAEFSSDVHFCRIWYGLPSSLSDSSTKSTLQHLMISLDQEVALLERILEKSVKEGLSAGSDSANGLTLIRLYQRCRNYESLFQSAVRLIDSYCSDRNERRQVKLIQRRHPYLGFVGFYSEFELLERKANVAFDLDRALLINVNSNPAASSSSTFTSLKSQVRGRSAVARTTSFSASYAHKDNPPSLRLYLPAPLPPLSALFVHRLHPLITRDILAFVLQYSAQHALAAQAGSLYAQSLSADVEASVPHLSEWTPPKTVLHALSRLLEYSKTDFDVISRFKALLMQKEHLHFAATAPIHQKPLETNSIKVSEDEDVMDYVKIQRTVQAIAVSLSAPISRHKLPVAAAAESSALSACAQWSVVGEYLQTGLLTNYLHIPSSSSFASSVSSSASQQRVAYGSNALTLSHRAYPNRFAEEDAKSGQQVAQQANLLSIRNLLRLVQRQQQRQKRQAVEGTFSSLDEHTSSLDAVYPSQVIDQLVALFDQVHVHVHTSSTHSLAATPKTTNALLNISDRLPSENEREATKLLKADDKDIWQSTAFVPFSEQVQRHVFTPLCGQLLQVKAAAYRVLAEDFLLAQQLQFVRRVFLLGHIDLLQPLRELILLLPVHHQEHYHSLYPLQQHAQQDRYQSQQLWQTLAFTLERHICETDNHSTSHSSRHSKPRRGIQHFSVTVPTLSEAHRNRDPATRRHHQRQQRAKPSTVLEVRHDSSDPTDLYRSRPDGNVRILDEKDEGTSRLDTRHSMHSSNGFMAPKQDVFDEYALGYLVRHIQYELHYQWPLSMLLSGSVIQRLQASMHDLLTLLTLKWLSEAWWKAIIPKGGLNTLQYAANSMRKARAHNAKSKAALLYKNSNNALKGDKSTAHKNTRTSTTVNDADHLPRLQSIEADFDHRQQLAEARQLTQARRHCQQSFVQVMHVAHLLAGFYLSRIHDRLWNEVMNMACGPTSVGGNHAVHEHSIGKGRSSGQQHPAGASGAIHSVNGMHHTIESARDALEHGVSFVEDLLAIIHDPLHRLFDATLKACAELRQAVSTEYRLHQELLAAGDGDEEEDDDDDEDAEEGKDYYAELRRTAMSTNPEGIGRHSHQQPLRSQSTDRRSRVARKATLTSRLLVIYQVAEIAFDDVSAAREDLLRTIQQWQANAVEVDTGSLHPHRSQHDQDGEGDGDGDLARVRGRRVYSLEFLRCVEELQIQCSALMGE